MSPVYAVVLAAGSARRFGAPKLTAPFRGGVLLDAALAAALAAPVEGVVVVTGADREAVEAAVRRWSDRPRLVHAADHAEGMAASLRAGIAALPEEAVGALIFLGDMPDIPVEIGSKLISALEAGAPAAVPVVRGRRGHPAALSRSLFPALLGLAGDQGARRVLAALGPRLVEVATSDPGVLADVDRPEDLAALNRR